MKRRTQPLHIASIFIVVSTQTCPSSQNFTTDNMYRPTYDCSVRVFNRTDGTSTATTFNRLTDFTILTSTLQQAQVMPINEPRTNIAQQHVSSNHIVRFQFVNRKSAPGYLQVTHTNVYSEERGYGFDLDSTVKIVDWDDNVAYRGGCSSVDGPFFFSVALPEGNYNVTVLLGHGHLPTTNTVKAESRRLMLENIVTAPGEFVRRTFTVNIRTPKIQPSGAEVRLKDREKGPPIALDWDNKLTLEFNGCNPCICILEIARADNALTVYLAGDSTVADQPKEPWSSWGQILPRFFKPGVAVANHAESGESLRSFIRERRLEKILSTIKTNDYLFIQFGHNDMKERGPGIGPFTSFKSDLKRFIAEARSHGAIPVLITPMHRKTFDVTGIITNSFGDYPEAVRQTAAEEHVPLIDLHKMSKTLYEALGPKNINHAFVDGSHHTSYGSYLLAKCVVEGIKACSLDLARFLADDVPAFDPAHPEPPEQFTLPHTITSTSPPPEGN